GLTNMAKHHLDPAPRALHGYFSRELAPTLTIDSGDVVSFQTLDAGWGAIEQEAGFSEPRDYIPRDLARDVAHPLAGPALTHLLARSASGVPRAITWPQWITVTVSARSNRNRMLCSMMTSVSCSLSPRTRSARRAVASVPRPDVGSSRNRMRGSAASATPISSARRSP